MYKNRSTQLNFHNEDLTRTTLECWLVATHVYYAWDWSAWDVEALNRRINFCIRDIPKQTVQANSVAVRKQLLSVSHRLFLFKIVQI